MQHVFSNCQHDISLFLPGEAIAVTILSVDIRKLMSVCLSIAFVMCVSNGQTLKRYHQVSDALLFIYLTFFNLPRPATATAAATATTTA